MSRRRKCLVALAILIVVVSVAAVTYALNEYLGVTIPSTGTLVRP